MTAPPPSGERFTHAVLAPGLGYPMSHLVALRSGAAANPTADDWERVTLCGIVATADWLFVDATARPAKTRCDACRATLEVDVSNMPHHELISTHETLQRTASALRRELDSTIAALLAARRGDALLAVFDKYRDLIAHVRPGRSRIGLETGGWLVCKTLDGPEEHVRTFREAVELACKALGITAALAATPEET